MSTRFRAIITSLIATFLFILFLTGLLPGIVSGISGIDNLLAVEIIAAMIISLVLFALTAWTLFFKRKGLSVLAVMLFPAVTIFPFTVFSDTAVNSILNGFGQALTSIVLVILFWLFTYLLVLTANILNGAIMFNIPLGQAGKAAQFVFSLISSYLFIAFVVNVDMALLLRVILIGIIIFYWTFSAVWMMRVSVKHVLTSSFVVALVMVLLSLVLTIWPIPAVYSTVISVIFYYVMLNVALEIRHRIESAFWLEYAGLVLLCFTLLFLLSNWGILGNLI